MYALGMFLGEKATYIVIAGRLLLQLHIVIFLRPLSLIVCGSVSREMRTNINRRCNWVHSAPAPILSPCSCVREGINL